MEIKFSKFLGKRALYALVIILTIAVSQLKLFDDYADKYTSDALTKAALSYAVARGINAAVSMLQTANVEVELLVISGSVSIGELLDPVNDLVERFSSVMTVAIGSLAAQKILLSVVSHTDFVILVWVTGLMTILAVFSKSRRIQATTFKVFAIVILVRFSLGIVVAANGYVDSRFLSNHASSNQESIESFKSDIYTFGQIESAPVSLQEKKELLKEHDEIQNILKHQENNKISKKMDLLSKNEQLKNCNWMARKSNPKCILLETEASMLEKEIKEVDQAMEFTKERNKQIQQKMSGTPVKNDDWIKNWIKHPPDFDIEKIKEKVDKGITAFMNLMALYLLKTIALPILFFYLFLALVKGIWKFDVFASFFDQPIIAAEK
jgi:hypothetical protein